METVIKVSPNELNATLLQKIKKFIGNNNNIDVTIFYVNLTLLTPKSLTNPFTRLKVVKDWFP